MQSAKPMTFNPNGKTDNRNPDVLPMWMVVETQLLVKWDMQPTEERRRVLIEIGNYVEARIDHEILSLRERETIPSESPECPRCGCGSKWCECAPVGDSHSGAVVVPHGSSNPPTDGSNGEGGP